MNLKVGSKESNHSLAKVNQHPPMHQHGWMGAPTWMDGCTFFVLPCPWVNQGGEFKLTFFFSLSLA